MGQRHQIYVALPKTTRFEKKVIGIHHQWLYGHTAIRMATLFLRYVKTEPHLGSEYHPFALGYDSPEALLKTLYSCDHEEGYYHNVCVLEDGEPEDPNLGDNNDGITVFDLRDVVQGRVSYCFANLYDPEDPPDRAFPMLTPVTGRTYARRYYPGHIPAVRAAGRCATHVEGEKNDPELRVRALEALKVPLMTVAALHEIFPKTFPAERPAPLLLELGS
jgi:hypothetical protein